MENKTIFLVGGGTGGHVVPVSLLYKKLSLEKPEYNIIVAGNGGPIEAEAYSGVKKYEIIQSGKFIRAFSLKNVRELFRYIKALSLSKKILQKYKPKLIFSKGGYVSLPFLNASVKLGIPYFIHESDIEMGMANKIGSKYAEKVFVGFPKKYYGSINQSRLEYSGQIINVKLPDKNNIKFNNDLKTILITGGSQGSNHVNNNIEKILPKLLQKYNIIHQAGENNKEKFDQIKKSLSEELAKNYIVFGLAKPGEIQSAIGTSDIVVARAGATTIAEIAISKKPAILIPYKYAAADHQNKNCKYLEETKAAKIILDDELNPDILEKSIEEILSDQKLSDSLGQNLFDAIKTNGLNVVASSIIEYMEKK